MVFFCFFFTPSVPFYKSIFEKSKSFSSEFDYNYFFSCYIIFNKKYTNENTFKTQIKLYILYQVSYNTKKNNYGQTLNIKTLTFQTWTYKMGRREYFLLTLLCLFSFKCISDGISKDYLAYKLDRPLFTTISRRTYIRLYIIFTRPLSNY